MREEKNLAPHPEAGIGFHPNYLEFFDCFNRQQFFEAHEVLEEIWLPERGKAKDRFYKGLIQLAGAFVHVQKQRIGPALSLLNLARSNLEPYGNRYEQLEIGPVMQVIESWRESLMAAAPKFPGEGQIYPTLSKPVKAG